VVCVGGGGGGVRGWGGGGGGGGGPTQPPPPPTPTHPPPPNPHPPPTPPPPCSARLDLYGQGLAERHLRRTRCAIRGFWRDRAHAAVQPPSMEMFAPVIVHEKKRGGPHRSRGTGQVPRPDRPWTNSLRGLCGQEKVANNPLFFVDLLFGHMARPSWCPGLFFDQGRSRT